MTDITTQTTIVCPLCGFAKAETVPTDACRVFYSCDGCGEVLRPLRGDCCVFCSYADTKCPPCQAEPCFTNRLP